MSDTSGGETYTYQLDEFGKGYLAGAPVITECPCDICQCPQFSEDGELCVACRNGFHDSDQE